MKGDPETRLIDASELRGRLAELLCDGPTTVYRRPSRAPVAEEPERAQGQPPAALSPERELMTQRNLTPLPYPQGSLPVEVPTGAYVVVSRPRPRATLRLLVLSAGAAVAVVSLASSLLGRAGPAPALPRGGVPSKPAPAVAAASPERAPTRAGPSAEPDEPVQATRPPCAHDALVALVEGRRRDAIVAYRRLGAAEPYPVVVRILERELQREQERRTP